MKFYVVKIPWNHFFACFYSRRASIWSSASIKEFTVYVMRAQQIAFLYICILDYLFQLTTREPDTPLLEVFCALCGSLTLVLKPKVAKNDLIYTFLV